MFLEDDLKPKEVHIITQYGDEEDKSVQESLTCPYRNERIKAVMEELESMQKNQVRKLVDLTPNQKAIGNKWVLKIKRRLMILLKIIKLG